MIGFRANKIILGKEKIGEQLREARLAQELELKNVAKKLNINYKYLEALETGQLNKLPDGIYKRNFLLEYARFLKLDTSEIKKMFEEETTDKQNNKQEELFSHKTPPASYFFTFPKTIKNIIIIIIVLICIAYLGFRLEKIISPPKLIIINPPENFITDQNFVYVQGITEPEVEITINEEAALIGADGKFSKKVNLKNGLNTISITAWKKYSKKNNLTREIFVKE